MRLIDGDTLKEAFYQKMKELLKSTYTPQISNEALSLLCGASLIAEAPIIEPPVEKTGKWIKMSDADGVYWTCSECGEDIPRISHYNPQFDLFPRLESINKTNFCPNCGSRMMDEEE